MRRLVWIILGLILLCDAPTGWGSLWGKNRKGNRLYEKGQYDEALKVYKDAQLESPESPRLHYNIGNTLYKKRKFKEAAEEYQKALRSDQPLLQEQTYYNLGNSAYRQGKLTDAIQFYKKALQLKPDDMDAKYNLEFVRKKLKEMAQKQPPKGQGRQGKKEEGGKSEQARKSPQPKGKEGAAEQKAQRAEEQKGGRGEGGEPRVLPKQKGMMSREEAERLLNALREEEKRNEKEVRRMKATGHIRVEKDW